jgi:hypothetical protein
LNVPRFRSTGYYQSETDGGVLSGETFTCAHCNRLVELKFGEAPAMCHAEWLPVCPACHVKGTCTPFEKKLGAYEARMRQAEARGITLRSMGLD